MKLGIAVVYLVSKRNEPLLDLHLRQIEENTEVPYTIYAAVNRLLPAFREKLAQHPHVKVCPCLAYEEGKGLLRQDVARAATLGLAAITSKYEHSFYLEQLIQTAIEDGVTHIAMLHVDSFPVRPGWASELAQRLSDQCVLVGVTRDSEVDYKPLTAGILYHRDFYLRYQPRLLLSQQEFDSDDYQRYGQACPHVTDSGYGYGFKMFAHDLTWSALTRSNKGGNDILFASIHGDLIFHLHAAAYVERTKTVGFTSPNAPTDPETSYSRRFGVPLARAVLPAALRRRIRDSLPQRIRAPREYAHRQAWERERRRLFDDPADYLMYLRNGPR